MKAHILIVEDDHDARTTLAYRLQYAGYQVTQAPDGETAIELLESDTFDLVLTDIVMRDVTGMEVLHTARMQAYLPAVILLTGHGSLETAITAVREGAFDYLLKPCDPDDLLACIEGAIQRHTAEQQLSRAATALFTSRTSYTPAHTTPAMATEEESAPPPRQSSRQGAIHLGALTIGGLRQEVQLHNNPIRVTPIEYAVLRYLAERPGQVQNYADIVRFSHKLDVNNDEAKIMLKTHVRNLRKKLGAGYIETERGIGYKMLDPDKA
jgi:two-component system, OmpR family, response regulator